MELQWLIATPEPDLQSAIGQQVGDGDVLGQAQRIPEWRHQDGLAEADARGAGAGSGNQQQRIGRIAVVGEVMLGDPYRVEAELVGQCDMGQRLGEALRWRGHIGAADQVEGAETHGKSTVLRACGSCAATSSPGGPARLASSLEERVVHLSTVK